MLLTIFMYFAIAIGLYYIYTWKNVIHRWNFVGPPALPFVGSAYLYFNKKPEDVINMVKALTVEYGKFFTVWISNYLAFFTTDVNYVEQVLSSQVLIAKNNLYDVLVPWLGRGLLLSNGKKWFNKRKIITPAFHFKILEQFVDVFDVQSNVFVEQIGEFADGELNNIYPFVTRLTLDVLCETAMGTKINAQTNLNSEYVKAVTELSYVLADRLVKVWQRSDFLFNLTENRRKQDRAVKILHEFTTKIIRERRNMLVDELNGQEISNFEDIDLGTKRKMAFLDVLLQSTCEGKPLTDAEIQEEVDTFMFEGHDTTTICVAFTAFLLAQSPDVQEKAYNEIKEIIGDDPHAPITYRNLQDLKYLELIIKESLRMYPPVPIIGRRFKECVNLDGKMVPGESNFNVNIFIMHRNPEYFPDPDTFKPERFQEDIGHPFAYIPFSAGPRNCIGQKFAMLEIKSSISKLLRHYKLVKSGPEPKLIMQLTLKPQNANLQIGFIKRESFN